MTSTTPCGTGTNTTTMLAGRQADSQRRRQRVITALNRAAAAGDEISVSGIARAAGVDRTFLYRHPDLLARLHALEARAGHRRRQRASSQPGIPASGPARRPRTRRPAHRSCPPARTAAIGRARRPGMERIRARRTRRHRCHQPQDHHPRAAGHRPVHAARRTRPGPGRRQGSQPRAHGTAQHHDTPVNPRVTLAPHLSRTVMSHHQPLNCANAKIRRHSPRRPPGTGSATRRTPGCGTSRSRATPRIRSGARSSPWPATCSPGPR